MCKKYNLISLEDRRSLLDMMFLRDICNNGIDCPDLVCNVLRLRTPKIRTRNPPLFAVPTNHTNYSQNSIVCRLMNSYNKLFSTVDLFHLSRYKFRAVIMDEIIS